METRLRASAEQFAILIEFMERNGDISRPQLGAQGRIRAENLWQELTNTINSAGSGVHKPSEKWKKVWADWKSKTKKKALTIRQSANRTGGGPSCKLVLTALEERVLAIMGLASIEGLAGIEERGIHRPIVFNQDSPIEAIGDANSMQQRTASIPMPQPSTSQVQLISITPSPPPQLSAPLTPSPPPPAPRIPSPAPLSTATTPRRRLQQQRRRRAQTPFDRAASEFVAVEQRRLRLEELRERNNNQRELERLRLDARRVEVDSQIAVILQRLLDLAQNFMERGN